MSNRKVDQSALKVNQALIIMLLIVAFVFDSVWLAALVALVMLLGTLVPSLSLFKRIYQHLLLPAGIVKPDVIVDNPETHRFAQGLGAVVLILAIVALVAGASTLGWMIVGLVVLLAALNFFLGFCAGCFLYYQLNRLGVPGFRRSPVKQA
ncbi:MAG TPA: DUF4395 domain-containing protein [Promineifilum sp.]